MDLVSDHRGEVSLRCNHVQLRVRVPATDINACVGVSAWRALLTVVGILLVVTDIPRAGLTLSTHDFAHTVGPGIVTYWGPHEYPVVHLRAQYASDSASDPASVNASRRGEPLESVSLWPYKFDTLSIPMRALAQHFNLTSFPPCVLYREPCRSSSQLEPPTLFRMLDDIATTLATTPQPLVWMTKTHWVDRLHHVLFRALTKNPENRLHTFYHYAARTSGRWDAYQVCGRSARVATESMPFFCHDPMPWKCDHPITPTGERRVPIWIHMGARVDDLQRRYPNLQLDVSLIMTTFTEKTHSDGHVIPSVNYATDLFEITTLIRGRQCSTTLSTCRTVFIDEYRYERITIESDHDGWTTYVRCLRGFSQLYIWTRVVLLVLGCHRAVTTEDHGQRRDTIATWTATIRVVLKIPSHTVVYGSWVPIVGYALAHHFDSCHVQTTGEFAWTSVGGFYDFDPVAYVMRASIQMRNIWMLAVVVKVSLAYVLWLTRDRSSPTHSARHGILAVRGGWIGIVSWLTTFGFMRALHFRDTDIVSIMELPSHVPLRAARRAQTFASYADYGLRFDLKCSLAACVVAVGAGWITKAFVRLVTGIHTSLLVSRSYYVPLSAGRFWPWSAAHMLMSLTLAPTKHGSFASFSHSNRHVMDDPRDSSWVRSDPKRSCSVCSFPTSCVHWRATLGCPIHEPILDIHRRTKAIWSMVRLTNVANMTDPIVLFRLYVCGVPLYVYRVHSSTSSAAPYAILLPSQVTSDDDDDETSTSTSRPYWTGGLVTKLEYVATVDSRYVPWHVLINCG